MEISSSTVRFSSQHFETRQHTETESLRVWNKDAALEYRRSEMATEESAQYRSIEPRSISYDWLPPGIPNAAERQANNASQPTTPPQDWASHSSEFPAAATKPAQQLESFSPSPAEGLEREIIRHMYRAITGEELDLFSAQSLAERMALSEQHVSEFNQHRKQIDKPQESSSEPERQGWGLVYDHYERYSEQEQTRFSADGIINTKDGKRLDFHVELNMSRSFVEQSETHIRMGDGKLIDPLVINFDGYSADIQKSQFHFDLDADGNNETLSSLHTHSRFLAQDSNHNGIIDNGKELFGAMTGDGFAELAQHDEDNNQWIDEHDAIYGGLRLWSIDSDGNQHLTGLSQAGIGAIYLGHTATPFQLKDESNISKAVIRDTSIWISEDGEVNSVQKLDFIV